MTQIAAQAQIEAIKKAQQKAVRSKQSALKFLMDAGIIKGSKKELNPSANVKKTK